MKDMKTMLSCALALAIGFCGIGCGDAQPQKLDDNYMKNGEAIGKERRDIFTRAGREYENMTPADKEAYLKTFEGNEEQAKRFWDLMKNPPGSTGMPSGMPTAPR